MVWFSENKEPVDFISGILLPKLFWPTVRKKCSSDGEKLLKFEAEGWGWIFDVLCFSLKNSPWYFVSKKVYWSPWSAIIVYETVSTCFFVRQM